MKYMGSKLAMLENGLGEIVLAEADTAKRFVDLFSGTGRVSWYVAQARDLSVLAADLQYYAVVLAGAVIERNKPVDQSRVVEEWLDPAQRALVCNRTFQLLPEEGVEEIATVLDARRLCNTQSGGLVWTAYGGHYFSPRQAMIFDILLENLPREGSHLKLFCQALIVLAASRCAASPGHTAQPFGPTHSALPHIVASWRINPISSIKNLLPNLANRYALHRGKAIVADANELARKLNGDDVVFVDPPYSSVHYSRFYHVLETLARGKCGSVTGVGRYPPISERPSSAYSIKSQALKVMKELLYTLSQNGCRVVLTFPSGTASNGMNGEKLVNLAQQWYRVQEHTVPSSRFSTMGGNGRNRISHLVVREIVATMYPL